ncbi:MAG: tetratricopeptide repeat protein [Proteobacteria bacterium]|nr:tetratricopeptide repeat protein [Pseudomonadota bacterium]
MDVRCKNCDTEYSLDETLVSASGTSVRCTKCSEVFKVYQIENQNDTNDRWLLRQVGGETFPFNRMAKLQQWISEGKVSPNDLLSRSGGPWKRLADIPEMEPFFASATAPVSAGFPRKDETGEAFAKTEFHEPRTPKSREDTLTKVPMGQAISPQGPGAARQSQVSKFGKPATLPPPTHINPSKPPGAPTTLQPPPIVVSHPAPQVAPLPQGPGDTLPPRPTTDPMTRASSIPEVTFPPEEVVSRPIPSDEPDLSQIPAATEDADWDQGDKVEIAEPAWTEKSGALPHYEDEMDPLPIEKRGMGRWIALFIVVFIIGGGAYIFRFERTRVDNVFSGLLSSAENDRYKKFFDHGREAFLLDSDTYYRQADREFQKVLALEENHAPTLAALAEMYAVWAQYLRDAELDARADVSAAGKEPEAAKREVERLHREFEEKLVEAARWAEQAIANDPTSQAAHRAMADLKRLRGDLDQAKDHLKKAKADGSDPETEYVAVLLDLETKKPKNELVARLAKVIGDKPLIRAMYRRARILADQGQGPDAKQMLSKLFDLNSDHLRGRDLAARIDEGKPVLLVVSAEAGLRTIQDAGPSEDEKVEVASVKEKPAPSAMSAKTPSAGRPSARAAVGGGGGGRGGIESTLNQAARFQESGQTASAVTLFKNVLERSPSNIDALSGLGYCYLDKGSPGKAIANFRRALGINSSFGPALLGLAETFKRLGQREQALKYYRSYIQSHPNGRQAGMARRNADRLESEIGTISSEQATPPAPEEQPAPDEEKPAPVEEQPAPDEEQPAPIEEKPVSGTVPSPTPEERKPVVNTVPENQPPQEQE